MLPRATDVSMVRPIVLFGEEFRLMAPSIARPLRDRAPHKVLVPQRITAAVNFHAGNVARKRKFQLDANKLSAFRTLATMPKDKLGGGTGKGII